ncbi:MAG: hypothetical protein CMH81_02080 [Nitrospiraceae bacterium]|jgi:hypothetical protein|nr:hypothetical protein [Nitrospiraceae bacterium]
MKEAKLMFAMMSIFMVLVLPLETALAAGVFDFLKGGEEGSKAAEEQPEPIDVVTGSARAEVNAIANLLLPGSGLMAIDLSHKTKQFCMLDGVSQRNMVHFSHTPENTTEDVLYFLNPETFVASGLNAKKLPPLPSELGEMTPHQWYYYDGTYTEPHHGRTLGVDFLVMAIDVK